MSTRHLYFLDAYNAGDPSFLGALGRYLAQRGEGAAILVDPADRLLLALEGMGAGGGRSIPEADVFRIANQPEARETARRVITEFTREVAAALTELQVPAVSLLGSDRGILRRHGAEGPVEVPRISWLFDLVGQGIVPVVAPLSQRSDADVIHCENAGDVLGAILLCGDAIDLRVVLFSVAQVKVRGAQSRPGRRLEAVVKLPNVSVMDPAELRVPGTKPTSNV